MPDQTFRNFQFSQADIQRVLTSPEGKRLLRLLNQDGGARLRQAADALKNGREDEAKQLLTPLMSTKEAETLVRRINRE